MFTCLKKPLQSSLRKNSAQVSGQDLEDLQDLENPAREQTRKNIRAGYARF